MEATAGSQHSEMEELIGQRDGLRRRRKEKGENKGRLPYLRVLKGFRYISEGEPYDVVTTGESR